MHPLAQIVICLAAAAAAGSLYALVLELRQFRGALESQRIRAMPPPAVVTTSRQARPRTQGVDGGYAIYSFRQGDWHLEADLSATGYEATPPMMAGTFENQVVKRESTLQCV